MKIGRNDFSSITAEVVATALTLFGSLREWEGRIGGAGCATKSEGSYFHVFLFGNISALSSEKVEKYMTFCREKAERLEINQRIISSWQTRDPENGKWGGAVRLNGMIYSFSGLPELGDEAVMLVVGIMNQRDPLQALRCKAAADEIARISNNLYFTPLLERMLKEAHPE